MNSFTRRNVGQMRPQATTQQPSNTLRPQNVQRGSQMASTGAPINFRANLGTPAQTQSVAQSAGSMSRPIFGPGLPVNPPSQPPMLMPAPPFGPGLPPPFEPPDLFIPPPSPPGLYPIPNPPGSHYAPSSRCWV